MQKGSTCTYLRVVINMRSFIGNYLAPGSTFSSSLFIFLHCSNRFSMSRENIMVHKSCETSAGFSSVQAILFLHTSAAIKNEI